LGIRTIAIKPVSIIVSGNKDEAVSEFRGNWPSELKVSPPLTP